MSRRRVLDTVMDLIGARPRRGRDLEPGIYSYQRLEGEWPTRFHLRVDPDEGGLLLANAAEAAYLSPVGTRMVRDLLEGVSEAEIIADVQVVFRGMTRSQVETDLARVRALLTDLSAPGDNYPITDLADERVPDWGRRLAAPFRADLVPGEPGQTRQLLQRLWEAGIPHVTFLARPEAPAEDLPRLVEAAEDIGMIAGLRAAASWLTPELIRQAALAGLDHLDLLYLSPQAPTHDSVCGSGDHDRVLAAFAQCHDLELAPVAQVPLYAENTGEALDSVFSALQAVSVTNLCFFALACPDEDTAAQAAGALPARALPQVALTIAEAAEQTSARYLWAPPVRYDPAHTLREQVLAGPRTAGDIAIRVEADGRVKPARGPGDCAGNLLSDSWEEIWNHDCFTRYRERLAAPTRCADCPDLTICAADCPKDPRGWSDDREQVGSGQPEGAAENRAGGEGE